LADFDTEEKTPLDHIPRKYATFAMVPVHYLKVALTTLEPISFGTHTLKGLLETGKKTLPRKELLNLLEFVTDIRPDTMIQPHQRTMTAFLDWLSSENMKKGRRGKDLQLRVDWSMKGHYIFTKQETTGKLVIKVKAQYADFEAMLPEKVVFGITDPSKLMVASNWSIHDASLQEMGTPFSVNLVLLFPDMCHQMIAALGMQRLVGAMLEPPAAEVAQGTGGIAGTEGEQAELAQLADGAPEPLDEAAFEPPEEAATDM
jgi:hypothetical protein